MVLKIICILIFCVSAIFPSNNLKYSQRTKNMSAEILFIEDGLRYVNTAMQFALPIIFRDKIGFLQSAKTCGAMALSTFGLKIVFHKQTFWGSDVSLRPRGKSYNMPSGHSSMASSAMFFIAKRYGYVHLIYLAPITALTMYARVQLKAHTISATIAGCVLGIFCATVFTKKFRYKT